MDWMIWIFFIIGFTLGTFIRLIIDFVINLTRKRREREQVGAADFEKQYMSMVAQLAAQQPVQKIEMPPQMQPQQLVQPQPSIQQPERLSKGIYFVNDTGELTKVERKGKKK